MSRAEELGYDSYWLTEHHFQHEGYEVIPNGILFGAFLAERTDRIRIGTMFNIIAQWHPLRLAEDFATLHNLSGGRAILGVGRGTVPREIAVASATGFDRVVRQPRHGRGRSHQSRDHRRVARGDPRAFENETFSYQGKYFEFPPAGIPDRGGFVETLR